MWGQQANGASSANGNADWWQAPGGSTSTAPAASGPFTPNNRPLQFSTHTSGAHIGRSTRFNMPDELDPEDARMAENIRFAPSFAASPAGKINNLTGGAMSPGINGPGSVGPSGMGTVNMGSPSGTVRPGRSPTGRFAQGDNAASPRENRRKQMSSYTHDEDMPPTASLRDNNDSPAQPTTAISNPSQISLPQSLHHTGTTTKLNIFGPPTHILPQLEPRLKAFGSLKSYTPGPQGSNWFTVEFEEPANAARCLRALHGEIVGSYMIGLRVDEGSSYGVGLAWDGELRHEVQGEGQEVQQSGSGRQIGTPLTVRKGQSVLKPAAVAPKVIPQWEGEENPGVTGRIADWLFGR